MVLEMISGGPNPISGGRNEVFAQRLVRYRKCGKSFTEGKNKREIKSQIRVVLRPVSRVFLFTMKKKNFVERREKKREQRQASPATNDSRDNLMTKLRRRTHDT